MICGETHEAKTTCGACDDHYLAISSDRLVGGWVNGWVGITKELDVSWKGVVYASASICWEDISAILLSTVGVSLDTYGERHF